MVVVYRDGAWYPEMPPSPPETVATLPGHRRCHPETLPSWDHLGTVWSLGTAFCPPGTVCHYLETVPISPETSPRARPTGLAADRARH